MQLKTHHSRPGRRAMPELGLKTAEPPVSKLLMPDLPRQHLLDGTKSRRSTNPVTALVQRIQDSPSATAVVLGSMGAMTLVSFTPREAVAMTSPELETKEAPAEEALRFTDSDEKEKELTEKVSALVNEHFAGDYQAAFNHYDRNRDLGIDKKELSRLLEDAKVGNLVTRGFWVDGVMKKIDREAGNRDGRIQWSEFQAVLATPV